MDQMKDAGNDKVIKKKNAMVKQQRREYIEDIV